MSQKVHLLVIDGQYDFCNPQGKLYVKGAEEDCKRVGAMIKRLRTVWDDVYTTYDSHNYVHIAHPCFWRDSKGRHPDPFTILTLKQRDKDDYVIVKANPDGTPSDEVFTPTRASLLKRAISYIKQLQDNKRYLLCVWPPHCLIGTLGWTLMPELMEPLLEWESDFNKVEKITKGSNIYTEHYSAVKADVPDPSDPSTQLNAQFINSLMEADILAVCGWASSHCLANTMRDVVNTFQDDKYVGKIVLLTDGTSPVPGFEKLGDDFIREMTTDRRAAGKEPMKTSLCKDFLS